MKKLFTMALCFGVVLGSVNAFAGNACCGAKKVKKEQKAKKECTQKKQSTDTSATEKK